MKKTIWKYPLEITDTQKITVPVGAEFLSVGNQQGQLCLWALVDPDAGTELRTINIYGTGNPIPESPGRHIGTVLMRGDTLVRLRGDTLVRHVFEPEWV